MPSPSPKTLLAKLSLSVAVLIALLGGLEALCRVTKLGGGNGGIYFEVPPAKAPGTTRILFLGASTVRGIPIPDWGPVAQLEFGIQSLRPELPIQLVNGGVAGKDSNFVRVVLDEMLDEEVDVVILLTGHNEFIDRRLPDTTRHTLEPKKSPSALVRAVRRLRPHLGLEPGMEEEIFPDALYALDRQSELFQARLAAYRENLEYMVSQSQERGIPVVLCTLPSNLSDWPPVFRKLEGNGYDEPYRDTVRELQALLEGGAYDEAEPRIKALAQERTDDAMSQYLLGRLMMAREQWAGAYAAFARARDLDAYPQRAPAVLNQIVRKTARDTGAILVDLERTLTNHADHGLVGFDLIGDNVHPSPYGNHVIAHAIIRALAANQILLDPEDGRKPVSDIWQTFREEKMWTPRGASLRLKYSLLNATYSMKVPFFNFEVARYYFQKALEQRPEDWRVWVNLATLSLLEGDLEEGRRQLQIAKQYHEGRIDVDDLTNAPYLRIALDRTGVRMDELAE